jgi:hypothetical protein
MSTSSGETYQVTLRSPSFNTTTNDGYCTPSSASPLFTAQDSNVSEQFITSEQGSISEQVNSVNRNSFST